MEIPCISAPTVLDVLRIIHVVLAIVVQNGSVPFAVSVCTNRCRNICLIVVNDGIDGFVTIDGVAKRVVLLGDNREDFTLSVVRDDDVGVGIHSILLVSPM